MSAFLRSLLISRKASSAFSNSPRTHSTSVPTLTTLITLQKEGRLGTRAEKKNRLKLKLTQKERKLTEPVHTVAHVKELHTTVDGHPVPAGLSFAQAFLDCPLVAQ